MRHNEGYRRPRGAWQPTQRQREVLDALAEGKTNAEIAVRLGITVDGAKWHVGELLAQTGLEDRQALARWWQVRRERKAPAWLVPALGFLKPAVAVLALAAIVTGIVVMLAPGKGEKEPPAFLSYTPVVAPSATPWPEEAVAALAEQDEPPATCEPPQRQDLRIVSADELRAQGLVDLGRAVFVGHCPLYGQSCRPRGGLARRRRLRKGRLFARSRHRPLLSLRLLRPRR